jgi:hypothetical protein
LKAALLNGGNKMSQIAAESVSRVSFDAARVEASVAKRGGDLELSADKKI